MLRDLFFKIKARDETAAAFAKVRSNLKGVEGAVASAEARIRRAGKAMKGALAGVGVSALGLGYAFRDSMALFDVQMKAQAKVANAVKATGAQAGFTTEELFKMASGLQAVTRFGDESILDGAIAQMLTFGNVTGAQFERAIGLSLDLATQLGGDLQGKAIMLGKALNDPVKGLSALRRVGIQFSEDQKSVIKSLVATGQVAKAQTLILDELNRQGYGGQAAAAALAGLGPVDQLKNAFGDLKEAIGAAQSEALIPVAAVLRKLVDGFLALPAPVQKMIALVGTVTVAVLPLAAGIGVLAIGLGGLSAPIWLTIAALTAIGVGIVAFWPQIKALGGWFVDIGGSIKDSVVENFGKVKEFLGGASLWFGPVGLAAQGMWAIFKSVFPESAQYVADMVGTVKAWLIDKLGAVFDLVVGKVAAVGDAFRNLWDRVVGHSYVPDLVNGIRDEFGRLEKVMVDPAVAQTDTVAGAFDGLGQGVGASLRDMVTSGEFTFRGFASRMLDQANSMADGIVDDAFGRVANAAGGLFGGGNRGSGGGIGGFFGSVLKGIGGAFGGGVPALDTGGEIAVGGRAGIDRNLAVMRVTRGETVSVSKRGASRGGAVVVNIATPSPAAFEASRGQVSATIARAVARGSRNL